MGGQYHCHRGVASRRHHRRAAGSPAGGSLPWPPGWAARMRSTTGWPPLRHRLWKAFARAGRSMQQKHADFGLAVLAGTVSSGKRQAGSLRASFAMGVSSPASGRRSLSLRASRHAGLIGCDAAWHWPVLTPPGVRRRTPPDGTYSAVRRKCLRDCKVLEDEASSGPSSSEVSEVPWGPLGLLRTGVALLPMPVRAGSTFHSSVPRATGRWHVVRARPAGRYRCPRLVAELHLGELRSHRRWLFQAGRSPAVHQ